MMVDTRPALLRREEKDDERDPSGQKEEGELLTI